MLLRNLLIIVVWISSTFILISSSYAYEFPTYQGITLKISGDISESYSNNITYATKNEDRVEDWLTNFALAGGVTYEGARRSVELSGQVNRQIITNTGTLENSSERAQIFVSNELTKYHRITISDTYIHTQVPGTIDEGLTFEQCQKLSDLYDRNTVNKLYPECEKFKDEFGRQTGRLDSYRNGLSLTYNMEVGKNTSMTVGYIFVRNWYPEEEATESEQNIFRFVTNYGLNPITIILMELSYEESKYDGGSGIDVQRVNTGIRQYINKRLYFEGKVGMDFSSSNADSTSLEASINGEIDKKTLATISYMRDIDVSETEDVFRNWQVSGNVKRELMEDFNIFLIGFYGKGDFDSVDVTDTFTGASLNMIYNFWKDKLGKSFEGRLGYTYSSLDSTDYDRSYTRTGLSAGLSVRF